MFTPDDLFAFLDRLGIVHTTTRHAALFTVSESANLKSDMPGAHTKNLFLKDKDGALILIAAEAQSSLPLNRLHKQIGTSRLSFGAPDLMLDVLGVTPGAVTAFALVNDQPLRVRFLVDAALMAYPLVNFHPLENTATTCISLADFRRFVAATGHTFEVIDFSALGASVPAHLKETL
jgi:Ala-tRNA(Pro) deacylase